MNMILTIDMIKTLGVIFPHLGSSVEGFSRAIRETLGAGIAKAVETVRRSVTSNEADRVTGISEGGERWIYTR